jgi:hypothetical protein
MDPSPSQKNGTQSVSQKSVRTIMFQKAPTNHKKHSKKEKRMELERVESLEEPSPCNDSALQIRDGLSSLQG